MLWVRVRPCPRLSHWDATVCAPWRGFEMHFVNPLTSAIFHVVICTRFQLCALIVAGSLIM